MRDIASPVVALLTPFDANGEIDWQIFKTYLESLYAWGVQSVVCNGTTGEFPSLTLKERQDVVEFVGKNFRGALINNVSSTCACDVRKLISGTRGHGDAVLVLPPYYYAGIQSEGLCRFFVSALSGASLPVFLYNFPKHAGNSIGSHLIDMLLDRGVAVAGIKDSGGNLANAIAWQNRFPRLKIFFANDEDASEALRRGLPGLVTGGANPMPEYPIAIQRYFSADPGKTDELKRNCDVWNGYLMKNPLFEIPLLKAAMGARITDFPIHVREPLIPAPAEEISRIRGVVAACLEAGRSILERR